MTPLDTRTRASLVAHGAFRVRASPEPRGVTAARLLAPLWLLAVAWASSASAELLEVSASFRATAFIDDLGLELAPVPTITGSFVFRYDEASMPASGQVAVAPLAAGASVGTSSFDETNTEVRLFFTRGSLVQFFWGGLAGGAAHVIEIGTDDLAVGFFAGSPLSALYTLEGSGGRFRSRPPFFQGSLSVQSVPEPGSAALLASGLLALWAAAPRAGRRLPAAGGAGAGEPSAATASEVDARSRREEDACR